MLAHHHVENWLTPNGVCSASGDPKWGNQFAKSYSNSIHGYLMASIKVPTVYFLIAHLMNNYLSSYLFTVCLSQYLTSSKRERTSSPRIPKLSRVAPMRCSVTIYQTHVCQCGVEEWSSTLLPVVHVDRQALAFWRLKGHWDKCSFSFNVPVSWVTLPVPKCHYF